MNPIILATLLGSLVASGTIVTGTVAGILPVPHGLEHAFCHVPTWTHAHIVLQAHIQKLANGTTILQHLTCSDLTKTNTTTHTNMGQ